MAGLVESVIRKTAGAIGLAVIITNDYSTGGGSVEQLKGTERDGRALSNAFTALRFAVCWEKNVPGSILAGIISEISHLKYDLVKDYECMIFIFAGHGCEGDYLLMQDCKKLQIMDDIVTPLLPKNARLIGGIKKAFLIDACRGKQETQTQVVPRSSSNPGEASTSRGGSSVELKKVPSEGNFLIAYSTMPLHRAYEESNKGGVWLSTVAQLLKERKHLNSLESLLAEANDRMPQFRSQQSERLSRVGLISLERSAKGRPIATVFSSADNPPASIERASTAGPWPITKQKSVPSSTNYRAMLNEYCQKSSITYTEKFMEDHSAGKPLFKCTLTCLSSGKRITQDSGINYLPRKDDAKEKAAQNVLKVMNSQSRCATVDPTAPNISWKSKLKEHYDKQGKPGMELKYKVAELDEGFIASVFIPELRKEVKGVRGKNKKEAEQNAAKKVMQLLQ